MTRPFLNCLAALVLVAAACSPKHVQDLHERTVTMVLRGWGFEPVIGSHVGEVYRGKYAGKPKERVSDLEWALKDPSIKAILCNRGGQTITEGKKQRKFVRIVDFLKHFAARAALRNPQAVFRIPQVPGTSFHLREQRQTQSCAAVRYQIDIFHRPF